jgi:raffinose/stachyose/melibiose transport system permease protein
MPPTAVAAIWLLVLSPTSGPVNQLLGDAGLHQFSTAPLGDPRQALTALFVAWVWSTVGVGMLLFWSGLRGIGVEFYQMAKVEGAGSWWRMVHVTLPALRRVAAVVALVNVVLAGQVFDLIYVTTGGGPGYATLILPLDMYARAFGGKTGQGSAVALAQILLIAIMVALILSLSRGHEPFGTGEPPASRRPSVSSTSTAAVAAFLSLLPLLWLLRALALPGRALALGNASPTMSAVSDNVRSAWDTGMSSALPRSLLLAVAVVAGTLTLAVPAAYSLSSLIRKGSLRVIVLAVLTLCLIQPAPVLVIPLFSLLRNLNLLDNPLGIVLPEIARAIPFAILAIWAGITGLAREPLLAARADGATSWQSMWLVALPLAAPAVWVAAAWAFLTSWNEYLLPTVVSQDGSLATVPTTLGSFAGAYDTQFGVLAAGTALALAPIMLLYLVVSAPAGRAAIALRGRLR